jgi:hypothetical protein
MVVALAMRSCWPARHPSPKKSGAQQGNHRFLALLRDDGQLDPAFLNVENGFGRFALGENSVVPGVVRPHPARAGSGQESLRVKVLRGFLLHLSFFIYKNLNDAIHCPMQVQELVTRLIDPTDLSKREIDRRTSLDQSWSIGLGNA